MMTGRLTVSLFTAIVIFASCHGLVAAIEKCTKVDDCSCKVETSKGEEEINIRSIGYDDQNKAPRFPFKKYSTSSPWEYAYNPCYTFSYGSSSSDCKDVVACQRSTDENFGLGDVTATWADDGTQYYVEYSHKSKVKPVDTIRTTRVYLACDKTAKEPTLDFDGESSTLFNFKLTSECACPGTCKSPGLSGGSVLCIIFSVLVIVYLVGGMIFMKFVRHAEGLSVIPNFEMWAGVPGNIRDGFVFFFNCGRSAGYEQTE